MTWSECIGAIMTRKISSGLSYSQLEQLTGVSAATIMGIKRGRGTTLLTVVLVCNALDLRVMCAGKDLSTTDIGDLIRKYRRKRKMSQVALAEAAGVGYSTISYVETGANLHIGTLSKILEALGIELEIEEA